VFAEASIGGMCGVLRFVAMGQSHMYPRFSQGLGRKHGQLARADRQQTT